MERRTKEVSLFGNNPMTIPKIPKNPDQIRTHAIMLKDQYHAIPIQCIVCFAKIQEDLIIWPSLASRKLHTKFGFHNGRASTSSRSKTMVGIMKLNALNQSGINVCVCVKVLIS